ncbi:MAG TPA: TIGR02530 family flagellar biosynthesis protein [bacterium]|nr:TIGR02530 family flagellar biosynthesis protein [bacterium]HOL46967.1 TIGR02530 family flagellar biosynthesis protein [bacterium]HPQ18232.1 TIGR02530 family flagellar biosynthesis protein [bacterium]
MAIYNVNNINIQYQPIQIKPVKREEVEQQVKVDETFEKLFQTALDKGVKFSGHAITRIQNRKIDLTIEDLNRLNKAIEKAKEKGAKESLVLMDDIALIVSVKNKTVITALDGESIKENVFTNIDSAIIV